MTRPDRRSVGALLALAALAGCDRVAAASKDKPEAAETAKRVAVVKPVRRAVARTITQPANVLALNEATLYAQVAGYLAEIRVDKGDSVKKGDLLATIEVPELEAERAELAASVEQAKAEERAALVELDRAESTRLAADSGVKRAQADLRLQKGLFDRAKDLRSDGVISPQDLEIAQGRFEEAQAAVTLAEARLKEAEGGKAEAAARIEVARAKIATATAHLQRAEARLRYSKIRAPFSGLVTRRFVDPGAMIQQAVSSTSASPLVALEEIDRVRVDFAVPESEVAQIASDERVSLQVDAYGARVFEGRVSRFAGALDPTTRTMLVEAEYDNRDHALRSGMFGRATLELERHEDALTVPAEAVRNQRGAHVLFVVENGRARRRTVELGLDSGPTVEIKKGLAPSESVVVGGARLTDDTPVVAVERAPTTADAKE